MCYYIDGDFMNSIGIICEYNPFHNGHLYHIKKIKEKYPNSNIILVMSGNFTQRGELSIIDKWDKTDIALTYGVNLVVELPFKFATQSADIFAQGAISILNYLKVDTIIFGSECNDINTLEELANTQINNKNYNELVKKYIDKGINYPTALSKALKDITGKSVDTPNDILGISYIREILKNKYNIKYEIIKRTNDYNDKFTSGKISSATSIRELLKRKKSVSKYVPKLTNKYIKSNNLMFVDDYYPFLKYKILCEINNLDKYQTVDEGLANRIKKYINESNSLEELIKNVKTKRYTYNKLKRMFLHILVGFTKEMSNDNIEYIRVLGFNKFGKEYLNKVKKDINIPIITNYSNSKGLLNKEYYFNSILSVNVKNNKEFLDREKKQRPIIK